jgi:malonyl-CoA O-methyltransferase
MSLGPGTSDLTPTMVDPPRMPARVATVRQQFDRRAARFAAHDALAREIERRLLDRLDVIRLAPRCIVDIGCGAGHSRRLLTARYPQATWLGIDLSSAMLRLGAATAGWLARMRSIGAAPNWRVSADAAALPLQESSVDLACSNLMLHWHPAPHTLFPEFFRVLRPDGLLLFSCFGPDTLKELRAACLLSLPHCRPLPFVDMHDFGDMMVASGFATPVMDVERLQLTYASPAALLREVRALGANPRDDRAPGLPSTRQCHALMAALGARRDAGGRIAVTIEVAYGHAWRPQAQPARMQRAEISVPLARLQASLRRR